MVSLPKGLRMQGQLYKLLVIPSLPPSFHVFSSTKIDPLSDLFTVTYIT